MGSFDWRPSLSKMGSTTWLAIIAAVLAFATPALSSSPRVVCYYTNWSVYRPGTAKFNPQNINPYLCTHLVYAFGGFTKDNTLKPFDKYQDIEKGGYAKFTGLKTYNKNLKTLLAIGGWNEGSSRFSPMVASKERRREFVRNVIKFLRQNHFDGLDLDWEYPAFRDGSKPKDREHYAKLVKELREEFERESEKTGKPRLLLTMAVPAGIEYIQKGYDLKILNKYLDWMNLLSYDYHSAFEPAVNHHAPLYPLEEPNEYSVDNELNIDYTIKFYLENGASPDKLVLGIPTYGRSYTLFNPDAVEIGSPAEGPGEQGDATREKGYLAFYEICEALKNNIKKRAIDSDEDSEEDSDEEEEETEEWTVMYPNPDAMGPVAYKGNQWVGYDDLDIVKKKGEYVAENGLGGIMFWSIDNDDFRGNCYGKPYPLIEAAKEAYINKLGSTENTVRQIDSSKTTGSSSRRKSRPRSTSTTTPKPSTKSAKVTRSSTPAWNLITPEPPTTPDPGSDFKCTDEGFFPHPRDCKKYFWCLDSGPSDLGIVAHQFTCPSGLFFNKAADSCDFARNVLCKKPASTTKSPTTVTTKAPTTRTTLTTTTTTTTRRPIRLTSKSSLLFRTSTTTSEPAISEEDEYEEVEDGVDVDAEDPKVIKELIDLIKKVGGVEQLEKHLRLSETGVSPDGVVTTTPANFNKRLYQKVLERARGKSKYSNSILNGATQNSRSGPQNAGIEPSAEGDKVYKKDRPQYVTINRAKQASTTPEPLESSEEDEGSEEVEKPVRSKILESVNSIATPAKPLQYVNIRRTRPTTVSDSVDTPSRNALFERDPVLSVSETAGSIDISNVRRTTTPEYVTIRRSRPTTEESSTLQYQQSEEVESQETALEREISSPPSQPQYSSIIRTRSTTVTPEEINTPEPTTILSVQISSLLNAPSTTEESEPVITTVSIEPETTTTVSTTTTTTATPTTRRNILRRRGSTSPTTTTAATTTQVSSRNYSFIRRRRPLSQPNDISDSQEINEVRRIRSTTPDSREVKTKSDRNIQIRRFRSRFQTTQSDDSVPAAASQVPRGQFRPKLTRDEVLSLTPVDLDDKEVEDTDNESIEVESRGRPTTISGKIEDSEVSAATIDEKRPSFLSRGRGRFSLTTESLSQSIATESPVNQGKPTFTRFTPRPFTRPSTFGSSAGNSYNNVQTEQPRNRPRQPFNRPRIGYPTQTSAITQARRLPFSSRGSTLVPDNLINNNEDDVIENKDDIALSETAIEEKENNEEYEEPKETTRTPLRSRVTIRKLGNTDNGLINESVVDETGKRKFRVIRRRPTTTASTTIETTVSITTPPSRIRKIIRKKVKPIEEEEIKPQNINIVNAGFNVSPNLQNYGEKTKSTAAIFVEEMPETTTVDGEIITENIVTDLVKTKTKTENLSDIEVSAVEDKNVLSKDNTNNKEIRDGNIKPEVVVFEEDKTIETSDNTNLEPNTNIGIEDESHSLTPELTQTKENIEVTTTNILSNDDNNLRTESNVSDYTSKTETSSDTDYTNEKHVPDDIEVSAQTTTIKVTSSNDDVTTISPTPPPSSSTSRSRLPYRPTKKLFTSTTESISSSSRTFSRKYNPGAYTSPSTVERPNSFRRPTTKRPLFSRPFTRRLLPTARTTPKYEDEEEEEEYSDEELLDEEPESPLVFVPPSQLFTRKPDSEEYEDNEGEDISEDEETDEGENYEEEAPVNRFTPSTRKPFFKPRVINSNTFRTSTTTTELPRPFGTSNQNKSLSRVPNKPVDLTKKRVQNVPVGYKAPKTNLPIPSTLNVTKSSTTDLTSPQTSTVSLSPYTNPTTTENDDDYLSMTETATTLADGTKTDISPTTNVIEFETVTSEMEIDNSTDDYLEYTTNYPSTNDYSITNTQTEVDIAKTTASEVQVTSKDINKITTTEGATETTTNVPPVSPIVKTQFDKLFSISRVVEVSSKSEKHRLNKNNETTLIEEGKVMIEKRPTVDKIGEVSRFSFIKIVEDEIPIYLTKLGHVYPVDNPPDNPIRIDEARNARALFDYSDTPKENLVASESMNEAYRHLNKLLKPEKGNSFRGKTPVEHINDDDFLTYVNEDKKQEQSFADNSHLNWQFVPAAYESEQNKLNKPAKSFDVITPRTVVADPSTLSLEGLFKTETPATAKKISGNANQPFVVYSASVPTQREANILKPEIGRSMVTFAKAQELKGSTINDDSTMKYPVYVSVISSSESPKTSTESPTLITTTTTTTLSPSTSPLLQLLSTTETVPHTQSPSTETIQTTITETPTTEAVTEEVTTIKISPLDSKRAKYLPKRPIIRPSNVTRYNSVRKNTTITTTTKAPFAPSKSRFSANRAQNVPVDVRRNSTTKTLKSFTTETPRSTTERRAFVKPIRPLRPAFIPRRLTTPPTTDSDT